MHSKVCVQIHVHDKLAIVGTALHAAWIQRNTITVQLLSDAGADWSIMTQEYGVC